MPARRDTQMMRRLKIGGDWRRDGGKEGEMEREKKRNREGGESERGGEKERKRMREEGKEKER